MTHRLTPSARLGAVATLAVILLVVSGCGSGGDGSGTGSNSPSGDFPAVSLARAFPALTFSSPVAMLQAPGDTTRWFVVQRGSNSVDGKVLVFPANDAVTPADVSEFISIPVNASGEGGLLGMAFHPNFPVTPYAYLSYTRSDPNGQFPLVSVVSRFTTLDGGITLDPASELAILTLDQPFANHNGGHIAFDRFGLLFIGLGDGGSGNDPLNHAQDVNTLFGAMLRIDVDGAPAPGKNYAIPGDNPFAAGGGALEIYAWGLRNPWRWSFDIGSGRLWLGDVGQDLWEEIDLIERGGNYGWSPCEGTHARGTADPCGNPAFIGPIAEYGRAQGCSVTGGYVYRGTAIPGLFGDYLFGDFCSGTVWGLRETGGGPFVSALIDSGLSVVSFGQSLDGEVYVINFGGTLHKLVPAP